MQSYRQVNYRNPAPRRQNKFWMSVLEDWQLKFFQQPVVFAVPVRDYANCENIGLFNCGRPGLAQTLGTRLKEARRAVFVGRERDQKLFQELLTGSEAPGVLW